jgi:hypothetical protein
VKGTVSATPLTFDFTYSGKNIGNSAIATGFITVDDALFPNPSPGEVNFNLPNAAILSLSVTVSGASTGNGTFGLADFQDVYWDTGGVALDFTKELVGQSTDGSPYGDPWGTDSGHGGDFNFNSSNPSVPKGVFFFALAADGGSGDAMVLTSMAAAVPEPATMLLLASGLLSLWGARKKFKK